MKKPERKAKAETCDNKLIGTYIFIILVIRVEKNCWRSLTHVWKTGMYARAGLEFVSCCKQQSGHNQVVGCDHNHHRKLQSASMLSDGNFYFIQPFSSAFSSCI